MSAPLLVKGLLCAGALLNSTVWAGNPAETARLLAGQSCRHCDLRYENAAKLVSKNVDLRGAYMFNINLNGARLNRASLSSANLQAANLERSDLSNANLARATLSHASLIGATLIASNLDQVVAHDAIFDAADLSNRPAMVEFS